MPSSEADANPSGPGMRSYLLLPFGPLFWDVTPGMVDLVWVVPDELGDVGGLKFVALSEGERFVGRK